MYVPVRTVSADWIAQFLADIHTQEIKPGPGGSSMTPAAHSKFYAADHRLTEYLQLPWEWVTIVALYPSSQIVAHRDPPAVGTVRYHIPLQTNPDCWCFHDGVWQRLPVGQIYSMNPREQHGAVNWGAEVRLHLMVDRVEEL